VLPEFLRTTPGALRSANPGASVAALGARAGWMTADHPLDYGYGPGTPLARLVEADGKVVMIGAPHDTMTLLHHAEHLATLPDKRVIRYEVPLASPSGTRWCVAEEFDTSRPVCPLLDAFEEDPFALIVAAFLAGGRGRVGHVGQAATTVVGAREVVEFAVHWLEATARRPTGPISRR
jgi:aminoglycoside 3-N-acetyltransferase